MGISIKQISQENLVDINQCDGAFTIKSRLVLSLEAGEFRYRIVEVAEKVKRYKLDEVDYAAYLDDPNKTVYLAY
jgi:hypothetical protein